MKSFDISLNGSHNANTLAKHNVNNSTLTSSPDFYIIKITLDANNVETDGMLYLIFLILYFFNLTISYWTFLIFLSTFGFKFCIFFHVEIH